MNSDVPAPGGPNPARSIQDFFGWIRSFGIYRPAGDRWGAGVAVGLARRWGIDPILVRGIFVALTFAGGLGVAAYGIAWLLLPEQDGRIHLQQAMHGHFTAGFIGAVLLSLALFGDPGAGGDNWFAGPPRFLALVFLIGLIWWMHRHQDGAWRYRGAPPVPSPASSPSPPATAGGEIPDYGSAEYRTATAVPVAPAPPMPTLSSTSSSRFGSPPPPSSGWIPSPPTSDPSRASKRITRVSLGLALIIAAVTGIIASGQDQWARTHSAGLVAAAAALAVIAGGIMIAGLSGRRSGGLAFLGFVLAVAVLIGAGVHSAGVRPGQVTSLAGDLSWTPATPAAARQQFNLGVGQAELRLTDPAILAGATAANPLRVSVRMGAGHLTVVTPNTVPATVDVRLGAGELVGPNGEKSQSDPGSNVSDASSHSVRRSTHVGAAGAAVVIVDVRQGAGQIELAPAAPARATPNPAASRSPATPSASAPAATQSKEKSNA